ncbi:MAG: hypothetical protein J6D03_00895 [Clostridia bacterium]|nr:hypothetical protein [Clostridia bacterium]
MKSLSQLRESFDGNPGNAIATVTGVMNHLTPVNNIITNVRNLFATRLGVVVDQGEDGISLKLHSSKFINQNAVNRVLDEKLYTNLSLRDYIQQQGLDFIKMVNLGQYWVVYFLPSDIYSKEIKSIPKCKCNEMRTFNVMESEIERLNEDVNGEEELEDKTIEEIMDLIDDDDKIKAATKLADVIKRKMELPKEYYWKAVKDQDGKESVALRYKYEKRRPFGKKMDMVRSIINIYNSGHDAIWVDPYDNKDTLDDDMKTLIENILKLLGAEETKDPCIFDINGKKDDNDKDDKEKEKENDDNNDSSSHDGNDHNDKSEDDDK